MKKYMLLVLCLCIALSVIPCAATDVPTLNLQSIHEYRKFASENTLPDHFITYEQLACFGNFEHMVFLEGTNDPAKLKYKQYDYTFSNSLLESRDEHVSLTLYYHTDSKYAERKGDANVDPEKIISSVPGGNMRSIPNGQSGVYITDGVEYRYVGGRLLSIEWSDDNYVYVLGTSSVLDTVTDKNELVNKFLTHGKTAEALEDFYQSLYPDQAPSGTPTEQDAPSAPTDQNEQSVKAPWRTVLLVALPILALGVAASAAVILIKRKIR